MAFDTLFSIALSTQTIHTAIFLDRAETLAVAARYSLSTCNYGREALSGFLTFKHYRDIVRLGHCN
jgi:hypothetical protein